VEAGPVLQLKKIAGESLAPMLCSYGLLRNGNPKLQVPGKPSTNVFKSPVIAPIRDSLASQHVEVATEASNAFYKFGN
jgi:hypothetical protein